MKTLLLILSFFTATVSLAQGGDDDNNKRAEKIQALKIAFISQKLQLTSDEAQRFWPVYNSYESEMRKAILEKNDNVLDNDERLLNLRKKYRPEFANIVGQPRVNKLFGAEREFRNVLMKHLKKRGEGGPGMQGGNRNGGGGGGNRPQERPPMRR